MNCPGVNHGGWKCTYLPCTMINPSMHCLNAQTIFSGFIYQLTVSITLRLCILWCAAVYCCTTLSSSFCGLFS